MISNYSVISGTYSKIAERSMNGKDNTVIIEDTYLVAVGYPFVGGKKLYNSQFSF